MLAPYWGEKKGQRGLFCCRTSAKGTAQTPPTDFPNSFRRRVLGNSGMKEGRSSEGTLASVTSGCSIQSNERIAKGGAQCGFPHKATYQEADAFLKERGLAHTQARAPGHYLPRLPRCRLPIWVELL